jgi:formyltetrahydrofolate deformylase
MAQESRFILTVDCPDRRGIVAAVSGLLSDLDCTIVESAHHADTLSKRFFMRTVFQPAQGATRDAISDAFVHVARRFDMRWGLFDAHRKQRLLLLVSKAGHCLADLLYRVHADVLPVTIVGVVSNHPLLEEEARWHKVPFHHLSMDQGKESQEAEIWRMVRDEQVDLVVLARYMQVLSPGLCDKLRGRCINIHHSFLPGFKGARPYLAAYRRGVKLIGATAHYVTGDLDEGPIIDQEVERVDHAQRPSELAAVGRDIERMVLARAVRYHVEHRVLVNGTRTVVFR